MYPDCGHFFVCVVIFNKGNFQYLAYIYFSKTYWHLFLIRNVGLPLPRRWNENRQKELLQRFFSQMASIVSIMLLIPQRDIQWGNLLTITLGFMYKYPQNLEIANKVIKYVSPARKITWETLKFQLPYLLCLSSKWPSVNAGNASVRGKSSWN